MFQKTPLVRVLFPRTLAPVMVGGFLACLVLFSTLLSILAVPMAYAATNGTINFQARLENAAGNIAPDGNYFIQFNLYNAASGGTALWTEQYQGSAYTCPVAGSSSTGAANNKIAVKNGYLTADLGSLCTFPSGINWDQDLWVTLNVGGNGGSASWDGEMNPRLHLTSVPYAFRAGQLAQFNSGNGFSSTLQILQPTSGNQTFQIPDMGAAGTYNVCIANSSACGFALSSGNTNYIQNQIASAQTSSNFWVSGTGRAATALQAPLIDAASAGTALNIGTTNASVINLNQNVTVANNKSFTANGNVSLKAATASQTAFQISSTSSTPLINVDSRTSDLVSNPSFEPNITNWSAKGTATLSQTSSQAFSGFSSLQAIVTAANSGVATSSFTSGLAANTQYELTFMASCSASIATFTYGHQDVSGTDINATTTGNCDTNWRRYTFHFTTGATVTSPNIYMTLGSATSGTLWVDAVQLTQTNNSGVQPYQPGSVKIDGVITDPVVIRNSFNSTNAFEVQDVTGYSNTLVADTVNNQVTVGGSLIVNNGATVTGNLIASGSSGNLIISSFPDGGQFNIGSSTSGTLAVFGTGSNTLDMNLLDGNLQIGGTNVITPSRALQNVTADTGILTSGTLGIARGGTGVAATPTNGQLLIGNGSGYTLAAITAGTGITVTNGSGTISIASSGATGTAGGDLSGTYPNPTVSKIQGTALNISGPTSGQILVWNGSGWTNTAVSGDITISSTGVSAIGTGKVNSAMIADGTVTGTDIANNTITNADIQAGTFGNITGTGALAAGSIASGFGAISTGNNITTTAIVQGGTVNSTGTLQTAGTDRIDASGNLVNIGSITAANMIATSGGMQNGTQTIIPMQRTLPTIVGNEVDIGTGALTNGGASARIDITVPAGGFSVSKEYMVPIYFNATGGAWQVIQPIANSGPYSGNDFTLEINVSNATVSLRLRRVAGTTAGTAYISLRETGVVADTFTPSTATSAVSAPTAYYGSSIAGSSGGTFTVQGGLTVANSGGLTIGGQQVITAADVLQNVTANASILTSGTIASGLLSGSYTGITAVGTLTGLTVSGVITSTVATGTAPLSVASTTVVTNLNADLLDGQHASAFAPASGSANYIQNQNSVTQTANYIISGTGTAGTLQATTLQGNTLDVLSGTTLGIAGTTATTVNLATNGVGHTINIATGAAAAQSITIGSTNASSAVQLQAATGTLGINSTGAIGIAQSNASNNIAVFYNTGNSRSTLINQWGDIAIDASAGLYTNKVAGYNNTDLTVGSVGTGRVALYGSSSSLTQSVARVIQGGTGDATVELFSSNLNKSVFVGMDGSSTGNFVINTSAAATTSKGTATPAHVQSNVTAYTSSTTSGTISNTMTTTAGNALVAAFTWATGSGQYSFTCSDDKGDYFYTAIANYSTTNNQGLGVCYATNITGGATTVTVTLPDTGSTWRNMTLSEYSGVMSGKALDVANVNSGTSTTSADSMTSYNVTTTTNNDLIYGVGLLASGSGTFTGGTGYTLRTQSAAQVSIGAEDKVLATAGSVAATMTSSTANSYIMAVLAFKPGNTTVSNTDNFANAAFTMSQTGAVKLQNSVNSTSAFQVQDQGGNSILSVDTQTPSVSVGGTLNVGVNDSSVTSPLLNLRQSGIGDTTLQISNPNQSWYLGQNQSNGNALSIASSDTNTHYHYIGNNQGLYSDGTNQVGYALCSPYTPATSGAINKLGVRVTSLDATNKGIWMALYDSTGSGGNPGNKIYGWQGTLAYTGWNYFSYTSADQITGGTKYWLCYEHQGTSTTNNLYYDYNTSSSATYYWSSAYGTWATNPTATGTLSITYSIYAQYVPTTQGRDNYVGSFFNLTSSGNVQVQSSYDSSNVLQVLKGNGDSVLNVDTTNSIVSVGNNNFSQLSLGQNRILQEASTMLEIDSSYGTLFYNYSNTTHALEVMNAAGSGIFTVDTTNGRVCINMSTCNNALGVTGKGVATLGFATGTPDIAEYITTSPDVQAYDVVAADPSNPEAVVKATADRAGAMVGAISDGTSGFQMTNAHYGQKFEAGVDATDPNAKPMTLAGRIPVHVTNENGAIQPGDYLTASATIPGYAMKATTAGPTVGKALGFFDASSGTVLALINLSYYNPFDGNHIQSQSGSFTTLQAGSASFSSLNVSGMTTLTDLTVTGNASFQGDLTVAGTITTGTIVVNGHIITGGQTPTISIGDAAGQPTITNGSPDAGTAPVVTIAGTDSTGMVTVTTGTDNLVGGALVHVQFAQAFSDDYNVVISASNDTASDLRTYTTRTNGGFDISIKSPAAGKTVYQFTYIVLGDRPQQTAANVQN